MSIGPSLSRLVLTRLVDDVFATGGADGLDAILDFLTRCGRQDGARLTAILEHALDRAWRAAETALADDPFWVHGRAGLAPADAVAFRQRLEMVLSKLVRGGANFRRPGATAVENALRRQCLGEFRAIREAGALADGLDVDEWARSDDIFIRFIVAQDRSQRGTEGELLRALEDRGCVGLMRVLTASGGLPLLVIVARAFICQGLGRLLRHCLQDCPEQAPDNSPLALELLHELSIPRFSRGRPAVPPRKRATALLAVPGSPVVFHPPADAGRLPEMHPPFGERPASAGGWTFQHICWQSSGHPAPPRSSWLLPAVLALGVALLLALPIEFLIDEIRQRADERNRAATEHQRLTAERRQLDAERQGLIDEQRRLAQEEQTRLQAMERQRHEEERRRRAEAEEARRQAEEDAVREAMAERQRRQEAHQARLREQKEKKEKARVVFERGLMHAAARHDEQALAAFTEVLELDPAIPGVWTERGLVRRRLGEIAGAVDDFTEAIRRDPRDLRAWINRGELHVARHDNSLAIEDFTAVIRLDPGNAAAYRERGACRISNDDLENALADETTAIALAPRDPWPYFHRAEIHRRRHDIDRAFADYSAAIDHDRGKDSGLAPAYRARGTIHLDRQEYTQAIADLTHALKFDMADVAARQARSQAYLQCGDWNNAILDADALIQRDFQNVEAYKMRGQAQLARQEYGKAQADFTRAIRLHGDAEVYYLRARAKVQLGDIDEAIYDCNVATANNPRLADAFYLRGTLRLQGGNLDRGREDRRIAHGLNPRFPLP